MNYNKEQELKKLQSLLTDNKKISKEENEILVSSVNNLDIILVNARLATDKAGSPLFYQIHRILLKILSNSKNLNLIFNKILEQGERFKCEEYAKKVQQALIEIHALLHPKAKEHDIVHAAIYLHLKDIAGKIRDEAVPLLLAKYHQKDLKDWRDGVLNNLNNGKVAEIGKKISLGKI